MKTKELIRQLQKHDPTGELECCVGNADIHFVCTQPAYWDGCLQVLKRNPNTQYYNIIGAKYTTKGTKVMINPLSISDAIFNDQDLPVEFDELSEGNREWYKQCVEKRRAEVEAIENDIEGEYFTEYLVKRFVNEGGELELEDVKKLAREFHDEYIDYRDPMPEDIVKMKVKQKIDGKDMEVWASWHDRRCAQWDREVVLEVVDGKLKLRKV